MDNNMAFVAELIDIQPIEGADRIVTAGVTIDSKNAITRVIVGKDTKEHEKVVYFDSNMCLNGTTILSDYPELARYLGKNGRVKTIKLKGVYSDGLVVPVEKFLKYDKTATSWNEGYAFTELNGIPICQKYTPPPPRVSQSGSKGSRKGRISESRMIPELWHFHVETDQLARNIHKFTPDDIISISDKWHGTSAICAHIPVRRKLSFVDRIAKFLGAKVQETEYDYIYSSRRVVKNGLISTKNFYSTDVWTEVGKKHFEGKLAQGETVYFEIVGYQSTGSWIQKDYDYGCLPGQNKIVVYRITKTSPDGHVMEYTWNALRDRCTQLNVPMVHERYYGRAGNLVGGVDDFHAEFLNYLRETYLEKTVEHNFCRTVPNEGIVVRKDHGGIEVYKLKSLSFLERETAAYERGAENVEDDA